MGKDRSVLSNTLASQKNGPIAHLQNPGTVATEGRIRPGHAKPTELLSRSELERSNLGVPHQKPVSEFVTKQSEKIRRHHQHVEIMFAAVILTSVFSLGVAAWVTEGQIVHDFVDYLKTFEPEATQSRNKAQNCKDPRNANTPYCQGFTGSKGGAGKGGTSWGSVGGVGKGQPMPFTLHGK